MNASDSELDKILAEYLLDLETGKQQAISTLCDKYPEHTQRIEQFFALNRKLFGNRANDSRQSPPEIPGLAITREIGRGGMGVVFEARQEALDRLVAVKVLRERALASERTRMRFLAEAELIAKLNHESTIQVYEAGEIDEYPYIVMELMHGPTLAQLLLRGPVSSREAARLLLQVSRAIQAAHTAGIIHRDIKPANILMDANEQQCKIGDFGLAMWTAKDEQLTQTGDVVGTPGYIAPEILRERTRGNVESDIYSLGTTLYALLTGVPPFQAATPAESLLLAMNSDVVPPRRLNRSISLDIESICLKCMHSHPSKRYESAGELADDLTAFLDSRPIRARPVGSIEKLVRWSRRNPWIAGTSAAAFLLLVGLIGTGGYSYAQVTRKNQQIQEQNGQLGDSLKLQTELAEESESIAKYLNESFRAPDPTMGGGDARMIDVLRDRARQIELDFPEDSNVKAKILATMGKTLHHAGDHTLASDLLQRALVIGKASEETEDWLVDTRIALANAYVGQGSDESNSKAIEVIEATLETPMDLSQKSELLSSMGWAQYALKDIESALQSTSESIKGVPRDDGKWTRDELLIVGNHLTILRAKKPEEALAQFEALYPDIEKDSDDKFGLLMFRVNFGSFLVGSQTELNARAIELLEECLQDSNDLLGVRHSLTLFVKQNLGMALTAANRAAEGVGYLEEVFNEKRKRLGDGHPQTWFAMRQLTTLYRQLGRITDAIPLIEKFDKIAEAGSDPESDERLGVLNSLSAAYNEVGRTREASEILVKLDQICSRKYGEDNFRTLITKNNLAVAYSSLGMTKAAVGILEQMVDGMKRAFTLAHPNTRKGIENLAEAYHANGETGLAIATIREAIALRQEHDGSGSLATLQALQTEAKFLLEDNELEAALESLKELLPLFAKQDGSGSAVLENRMLTARALAKANRVAEALAIYPSLHEQLTKERGAEDDMTLLVEADYAFALRNDGRIEEALSFLTHAHEIRTENLGETAPSAVGLLEQKAVFLRQSDLSLASKLQQQVVDLKLRSSEIFDTVSRLKSQLTLVKLKADLGKIESASSLLDLLENADLAEVSESERNDLLRGFALTRMGLLIRSEDWPKARAALQNIATEVDPENEFEVARVAFFGVCIEFASELSSNQNKPLQAPPELLDRYSRVRESSGFKARTDDRVSFKGDLDLLGRLLVDKSAEEFTRWLQPD